MNRIYKALALFLPVLFFSCTSEIDDAFDKSAADRIDDAVKNISEVLVDAPNGWLLQYFPSSTKDFGGYSILVGFAANGTVKASCDLFAADKVSVSNYTVAQSNGPILTFDTYNEVLHFFSEPSNYLGIGETGDGMLGDTDFLVLECNPDKVVLKGKKTGNKMTMTPVPSGSSWKSYLSSIKSLRANAFQASYDVVVDGVAKYSIIQKYRKFILVNADGSSLDLPFVYTPTGISLYENVSISGYSAKDFAWNSTKNSFECGNVSFVARELPKDYTRYSDFVGNYKLVYENGDMVADVELVEELFNESLIMKGFMYDIRILYKADAGYIGIETQRLSDNIYLCAWALGYEGALSGGTGLGVVGKMVDNDGTKIIYLSDNGVWGSKKTDSFIAYDYNSGTSVFQIPYLAGFVKVD